MPKSLWPALIEASAHPAQARQHLEALRSASGGLALKNASEDNARILITVLGASPALSGLLIQHPDWASSILDLELLRHPRLAQGLEREVNKWLIPALDSGDYESSFARLREFKQREMLRIAARDLNRLAGLNEIVFEISNVADVCLSAAFELCHSRLSSLLGQPYHQDINGDWHPTEFCILGMGKLGGEELNYSSDIDVLFVYSEEGTVFKEPPRKSHTTGRGVANHQFFRRLCEAVVGEVSQMTAEGALFGSTSDFGQRATKAPWRVRLPATKTIMLSGDKPGSE